MSQQQFNRQYNHEKNYHKKPVTNHTSAFMQKIQHSSDRNRSHLAGDLSAPASSSFTYHGDQQQAVASDRDTIDEDYPFSFNAPATSVIAPKNCYTSARYLANSSPRAMYRDCDTSDLSPSSRFSQSRQSKIQANQQQVVHPGQPDQNIISNNQYQIKIESPCSYSNSSPTSRDISIQRGNSNDSIQTDQQSSMSSNINKAYYLRSLSQEGKYGIVPTTSNASDQYSFFQGNDAGMQHQAQKTTINDRQDFVAFEDRIGASTSQSPNQDILRGIRLGRSLDDNPDDNVNHENGLSQHSSSFLDPSSPLQSSQTSSKQSSHSINSYNKGSIPPSRSDTSDLSYYDEGQSSLAESHSLSSSSTVTTIVNNPTKTSNMRLWKKSASASSASLQSSSSHSLATICSSLNNTSHGEEIQTPSFNATDHNLDDPSYEQRDTVPSNNYPYPREQVARRKIMDEQYRLISSSLSPTPSTSSILTEGIVLSDTCNQYPINAYRTRSASSISSRSSPSESNPQSLPMPVGQNLPPNENYHNLGNRSTDLKNKASSSRLRREPAIVCPDTDITLQTRYGPTIKYGLEKSETVGANMMNFDRIHTKNETIDVDNSSMKDRPFANRSGNYPSMTYSQSQDDKLGSDFPSQVSKDNHGQRVDGRILTRKPDNSIAANADKFQFSKQETLPYNNPYISPTYSKYYIMNENDGTISQPVTKTKINSYIDCNKESRDATVKNLCDSSKQYVPQICLQTISDCSSDGSHLEEWNRRSPKIYVRKDDDLMLPTNDSSISRPDAQSCSSSKQRNVSMLVPSVSVNNDPAIEENRITASVIKCVQADQIKTEPIISDENIQFDKMSKINNSRRRSPIDEKDNCNKLKAELRHLREVNLELQRKVKYLEDLKLINDSRQYATALSTATNNMSRRISRAGTKFFDQSMPTYDDYRKYSCKSTHNEKFPSKDCLKQHKNAEKHLIGSDGSFESNSKGLPEKHRISSKHKKRDSLPAHNGFNWTRNRSKSVGYGISRKSPMADTEASLQELPPNYNNKSNQSRDKYSKAGSKRFPWTRVKEAFGWINQPQSGNMEEAFGDLPYSITVEDIVYDQESISGEQSDPEDTNKLPKEKQTLPKTLDIHNTSQPSSRTSSKKWYNMKTIIGPNKKPCQNSDGPPRKLPKSDKNASPYSMNEQHCESNIDNISIDYTSEVTTVSECSDNSSRRQQNSQEFLLYVDKVHQAEFDAINQGKSNIKYNSRNNLSGMSDNQQRDSNDSNNRPRSIRKGKTSEAISSTNKIENFTSHPKISGYAESTINSSSSMVPTRSPSISSQAPSSPSYMCTSSLTENHRLNSPDPLTRNANNKSSRWKQMKKVFTNFDTNLKSPTAIDTASVLDVSLSPAQPSPSTSCHFTFDIRREKEQSTDEFSTPKSPQDTNLPNTSESTNNCVVNLSSGSKNSFFKKEPIEQFSDTDKNKFIPLSISKSTPVANLVNELQKNLTNDFNKKNQEWEKRKNMGTSETAYANVSKKNSTKVEKDLDVNLPPGSSKQTPPHSRSASPTLGQISSHSIDQAANNNITLSCKADKQKVNWLDKELQKIQKEWEKLRKEELKYEERATRLMRLRESVLRGDIVKDKKEVFVKTAAGEFRFEGISHDFTKKLYEWETKKNVKMDMSTIALLDNLQNFESSPTKFGRGSGGKKKRDGGKRNIGVGESSPDDNYYCWLDENMFLLDQLRSKEEICRRLEGELNKLDEGMNKMSKQHELEMEKYRQKLWELHKLQSNPKDMETSIKLMTELKGKIDELQACGERLRNDKQALEDSFRYHSQQQAHLTIDLIEKMRDLQQLTYNKCGLPNSSQESNTRSNQKRSYLKCDMESLCKLHELSTQLMDQARNLENRLAERTRQICQLRWELIDSDVKAMRIQTELESLKWQTSKRAALRRSRYGQRRSWSSSERLFHRVIELDETAEVRSSNCELAAAPSMRGSSYEFVEFPSSDLSDWLKFDEESGSISDTVQLLKLELLKLGTLDKDSSVAVAESNSVQSGINSIICDQVEEREEREESELRLQEITSLASESSETSGIIGLNDSLAEKEVYVIRLPRKRMDHMQPQTIVPESSTHTHNQINDKGQISTISNIISSSSLDSQSMVEEDINQSWDMRSSTTCDPPTSTTNTSTNTASVVATSSDSNNSLDSNSLPNSMQTKNFEPNALIMNHPTSELLDENQDHYSGNRQLSSHASTSRASNNDAIKDSKLCTEFYKSRQIFVKLTECAEGERSPDSPSFSRSDRRWSIKNKSDCKKSAP